MTFEERVALQFGKLMMEVVRLQTMLDEAQKELAELKKEK